ncbi:MAG: hypothetical protein GEV28_04385 [Actinophytocola sp.]|uniref:hypothetical protein n=1 Tax=Actinophytocola sp. TaxID=1872138 RepID=UPI00132ADAAD|nr:hypothetical protein [Actinophytocola sp.]MPZ79662.1 hypothetical protein [Actinophytocola sp.]
MCHKENGHSIPNEYRLIDETTLSFLWFQTAGITLHYFGAGKIQPVSDAEQIDCVASLGRLYQEHGHILPDEAQVVMDCLITAAIGLTEGSDH